MIRQIATDVWQENFQKDSAGAACSNIEQFAVSEKDDIPSISLSILDDAHYAMTEKRICKTDRSKTELPCRLN